MQLTNIPVNKELMELTKHGSPEFPIEVYLDDLSKYDLGYVRWHWHKEFEFAVVKSGTANVLVGESIVELGKGEGVFVNANALHQMEPIGTQNTVFFSIVFSSALLAGQPGGAIDRKYIIPVLESGIQYVILRPSDSEQNSILKRLEMIYEFGSEKEDGYELLTRSKLTELWFFLVNETKRDQLSQNPLIVQDEQRIKTVINYIQSHFTEGISLDEIASAAHLSKSECCRCCRRVLKMTPFEYLMRYRISEAVKQLNQQEGIITEIAGAVGFNSTSYFDKIFKRFMGYSPTEYQRTKHWPNKKMNEKKKHLL